MPDEAITEHRGTETEDEYDFSPYSKGLFVIISISEFDSAGDLLGYKKDVENLATLFKLKEGKDWRPNVKVGENMQSIPRQSAETEQKKLSFDDFMECEVLGYKRTPSFLLFFLMSHGNEEYFLLSNSCGPPCKNNNHSYTGACAMRNYNDAIFDKISQNSKFSGIPKVFVMQHCRGVDWEAQFSREHASATDSTRTADEEIAMSDLSDVAPSSTVNERLESANIADRHARPRDDCFVLFSCTKDQSSLVQKTKGSMLIQALNKVIKMKLKKVDQCKTPFRKMLADFESEREYSPRMEDLTHGWMTDILSETCSLGAKTFWVQGEKEMEGQPEYIASQRLRLSFIKILETQNVVKIPLDAISSSRGKPFGSIRKCCSFCFTPHHGYVKVKQE